MKTVFSVNDYNYNNLSDTSKGLLGEIIIPYINMYTARESIAEFRNKGRIVFTMDIEPYYNIDMDRYAKDAKELLKVCGNLAFMTDKVAPYFHKRCPNSFPDYKYAVHSYQEAMGLFNVGVREVYVTGSLAANLTELKQLRQIMKIRVVPNIVQADAYTFGNPCDVNPLQSFWIRPEAAGLYDGVVNTFEIMPTQLHNEAKMLDIYAKREYKGKLGDVIVDFTEVLNGIVNDYDVALDIIKTDCGLGCFKSNRCGSCQSIPLESMLRQAEGKNS